MPTVPFVALDRQHAALREELDAAWARVVESSGFILGDEVEAFEREFGEACGANHCVGVASGTAAIGLALNAAGIGAGDEVVVPGHTFIASALGVLHAGATPVFCDVEEATGLIDPESAAEVVTPRTAAIVAVHLYGQACDMTRVGELAKSRSLFVLEDAAQAHGATWVDAPVGSLGDAAAFSFYPSKNLGALGDGGAVTARDPDVAQRVRELRHIGQRGKGEHVVVGVNERLDGLQAALLRVKLRHLDAWNDARRRAASRYDEHLAEHFAVLPVRERTSCVYHLYPVRSADRDGLADQLAEAGVATGVHYHPAAHRHPAFDDLPAGSRPIDLPQAEAWAAEELSLPMFAELEDAEIDVVVASCCARITA